MKSIIQFSSVCYTVHNTFFRMRLKMKHNKTWSNQIGMSVFGSRHSFTMDLWTSPVLCCAFRYRTFENLHFFIWLKSTPSILPQCQPNISIQFIFIRKNLLHFFYHSIKIFVQEFWKNRLNAAPWNGKHLERTHRIACGHCVRSFFFHLVHCDSCCQIILNHRKVNCCYCCWICFVHSFFLDFFFFTVFRDCCLKIMLLL